MDAKVTHEKRETRENFDFDHFQISKKKKENKISFRFSRIELTCR